MIVVVCGEIVSSSNSFKIFRSYFLYNKLLVGFSYQLLSPSCDSLLCLFFPIIFLVSLISTLMNSPTLEMANTRNCNANNDNNQGNPPPPPTLEQVLIMQAQMLQTMQQTMANIQHA
jgi:hypothetical protein